MCAFCSECVYDWEPGDIPMEDHKKLNPACPFLGGLAVRGVINGKAGEAAALPKFSDMLTLSQLRGADYAQLLALPRLNFFIITPL